MFTVSYCGVDVQLKLIFGLLRLTVVMETRRRAFCTYCIRPITDALMNKLSDREANPETKKLVIADSENDKIWLIFGLIRRNSTAVPRFVFLKKKNRE